MLRRFIFFVVVFSITAFSAASTRENSDRLVKSPMVDFVLIGEKKVALASLRGRTVLVNFWATTCVTCIKEIPRLIESYNKFKDRGFELIAVAMPYDPPSQVWRMARDRKLPYKIALDLDGSVTRAFKPNGTPSIFLISPNGDIVYSGEGLLDFNKLERIIESNLPYPDKKLSG